MTAALFNYDVFFKKIMYRVCKDLINQMVSVVEFKRIFGCIYDQKGALDLKQELALLEDLQKEI